MLAQPPVFNESIDAMILTMLGFSPEILHKRFNGAKKPITPNRAPVFPCAVSAGKAPKPGHRLNRGEETP
jgi:hypothetical protein